jgi:hypothetical protein
LEQLVPIVILLILLLLDGDEALSCFFLPLGVLMKSIPDLLLSFLNGGEPGVETSMLHLLLMKSHGRWMMAPCDDHVHLWGDRGSHEQRRTCVLPESYWKPPHRTAADSSRSYCPAIARSNLDARNSPNDAEKVAPTQHVQVGAYGRIPAGPNLYVEDSAPGKVLLAQILCSW